MSSLWDICKKKENLINEQVESPFGTNHIISIKSHAHQGKLYLTLDNHKIYLFPDSFVAEFLKFKTIKYQEIVESYIRGTKQNQISKRENQDEYKKKYEKLIKKIGISGYISKEKIVNLKERLPRNDFYFIEKVIKEHNLEYIDKEEKKYSSVFKMKKENFEHTIQEYELDQEQKFAVISDEISTLVVAGAGCGKTSMLLAKINYLLRKGISPDRILVISYTNKTIDDLKTNLAGTSIIPKTIHALGKEITAEKRRIDDNLLRDILQDIKKKELSSSSLFSYIKEHILNYLSYFCGNDLEKEYNQIAEGYTTKIKIQEYETKKRHLTLKYILNIIQQYEKENKTLKGQKVKSLAEAQIANFLFLNGVDYTYEATYNLKYHGNTENATQLYKPDFLIKQDDKEIWLEHFGVTIDENGIPHAAWCEEEDNYIQQMKDKIKTHQLNNTTLIQTNQSLFLNETLLTHLKNELEKHGLVLKRIEPDTIINYFEKLKKWKKYEAFESFLERYISLFKTQLKYRSLNEIENELLKDKIPFQNKTILFFKILKVIYKEYENRLNSRMLIDYSDMIKKAIEKLKEIKTMNKYDYIIVDEFQDIDQSKCELLRLLQEKNNAKLFCVGDDWQSIYGFTGSDVSIFNSFSEIFPYANTSIFLKNTHRNSKELLDITSRFITKNPLQTKKQLISLIRHEAPLKVCHFYSCRDKGINGNHLGCFAPSEALKLIFEDMKKNNLPPNVVILGRYREDYQKILKKDKEFQYVENSDNTVLIKYNKYQNLQIKFMTIHQSKGLDFDTVILFLQEAENQPSFPTGYEDNYLMKPLLYNKKDTFPNAEERRIFYVALTRCKKQCYIINPEEMTSSFFQEIKHHCIPINDSLSDFCYKTNQKLCPGCKKGIYSEHSSNDRTFWACSNRLCTLLTKDEAIKSCPKCNGVLVKRINKKTKKEFFGCSNYPKCNHITNK